jgi:hypothetical protein
MTIYETDTNLYQVYDGSNWVDLYATLGGAWETYTPTVTNWTLGSGSIVGRYQRIGRFVVADIEMIMGSTTGFSSNLVISLPITAKAQSLTTRTIGFCQMFDVSASFLFAGNVRQSTNNQQLIPSVYDVVTTYAAPDSIISTRPFSWTNLDEISITAFYEAAS